MYNTRILSPSEELYSNRAKQKIAELALELSNGFDVNDVPYDIAQCILDLNYSIQVLESSVLDWTEYEIQSMIDYYSLHCGLVKYPYRSMDFYVTPVTGTIWATVAQLAAVDQASRNRDNELLIQINELIDAEAQERADEDASLQAQIDALQQELDAINNGLNSIIHSVSNLRFTGYQRYVEAGVTFYITNVYWDSEGTPEDLILSDNKGIIYNIPVSGNSHTFSIPRSITLGTQDHFTLTLDGSNTSPTTIGVSSIFRSYYGKKVTTGDIMITVTEADILASGSVPGYSSLVLTEQEINFIPDTTKDEQGWIAVESAQTVAPYTYWRVDDVDNGNISSSGFILPETTVAVNGRNYSVYRWRYRTPLSTNIRLSRNA